MRRECERCVHFRPQRNLTECLRLGNSLEVAKTMHDIMTTERQLIGAETGMQNQLQMKGSELWERKPAVLAYCGIQEADHKYYVHLVKNAEGRCRDFQSDDSRVRNTCDTCVHRVPAPGPAEDGRNLLDFISPASNFHTDHGKSQPNSGPIMGNVDTLMKVSGAQQTEEMVVALNSGGAMPWPPRYYATCRKYSTPGNYTLCRMHNPHNRCGGWSGVGSSILESSGQTPPARETPPDRGQRRPASGGEATFFRSLARKLADELRKG